MTVGKMVRNVLLGLIFGVLAIGLMPFLIVFNWAEMLNLAEFEASPLFMLLGRYIGQGKRNGKSDEPERQSDQ
ncbi:hypothetical protein [Paenibacillus harenae]|uniref:Membrane-associated HD superfamily phosphohydrolase n=1 Tax=Paenibacillus harenae TaxID=306543 RepID=A0ABT9UAP4_PAEHA|nr:hypothetical protein [Paenibacillus harenae]MDQ0059749.1 membrane-associated HD superfamily phosphohydrolase [Paenibacillus harenae]MDQ0116700.1 membrane-associated HD superfamily phosphohydrolase [Paenibacillus harenae]